MFFVWFLHHVAAGKKSGEKLSECAPEMSLFRFLSEAVQPDFCKCHRALI